MADDNGKAPAPASAPADSGEAEAVPASDRAMAVIGALVGLLIIAIAIDLWSGGALSRLVPAREAGDDDG